MLIKFKVKDILESKYKAKALLIDIIYIEPVFLKYIDGKIFEINTYSKVAKRITDLQNTDDKNIQRILFSKEFAAPMFYKQCLIIPTIKTDTPAYLGRDLEHIKAVDIARNIKIITEAYKK